MNEYTPTTEEVRDAYSGHDFDQAIAVAQFDRWLAEVERDAAARALEEAAQTYPFTLLGVGTTWHEAQKVLCERAAEIREGN